MASSSDRKELKAQWKTEAEVPTLTLADVAKHKSKGDNWIVIHGHVYNVTEYARDHPGGAAALEEVAGQDATSAYEDVGHSEDAREVLHALLVGVAKDATAGNTESTKPKVQVVRRGLSKEQPKHAAISNAHLELAGFSVSAVALVWYLSSSHLISTPSGLGSFNNGFVWATVTCATIGVVGYRFLSQAMSFGKDFTAYPAHLPVSHAVVSTNRPAGALIRSEYQKFKLVQKEELAKDIYRFVFQLPGNNTILGLPIGQHIAIRGYWDDDSGHHTVTRSYTPVSNNRDLSRLELVIRCYPDGLLTGKYLVNLTPGDAVEMRGPTGAMRYRKGMARRIGMIAGGTGITPMYQLIRAICEDSSDDVEVSLVYANRSEADILMRNQLDRFARASGGKFKIYYMLDKPPPGWKQGTGFVNEQVIREHLPAVSDDTKMLLCGPPGLVNASKKTLVALGFGEPGAVSKITDQIFCF